jgi:hypothetical protein
LKPLSGTNAKNGAITPSLTPTMQARCYNAGKRVRATRRGYNQFIEACRSSLGVVLGDHVDGSFCACACGCVCLCNLSKHVGALLVVDLGILWLLLVGESFYAYLQCRPADW